jgi:beta-lactamase regulating signal transducer with metallopeptidase domain
MIGAAMFTTILTFNGWAGQWLVAMGALVWQSTLLVAVAALVAWLLRRSSPVVRYWLWQIVAVKLLLMPFWTFWVPLPTWAGSRPVAQSTTSQPITGPVEDSSRGAPRYPSGLAEGSGSTATSHTSSLWEPLAAVSWQTWLLLTGFAIVLWQLVRLLGQRLRLARLLRQSTAAGEDLAQLVAELAGQLGLRRVPTAVSVTGDCPLFVCGLWRSRLVLPSRLMASLDRSQRRQVILHELAHVKRHDLAWGWPVEIARIVYFFHPLVYWVAYQLRLERELACDQLAMAHSGHPPADYAQTLVQVVSHASAPAAVQAAAIATGVTGSVGQRPVDFPSPGQQRTK